MVSAALMGVMTVGSNFLPVLLSYTSGGDEGHGGGYAAWTAVAGFAASALVARRVKPELRGRFMLWSAIAVALLTVPLAAWRGYQWVMVYGLGMAVAASLFNVPLFAAHIRIVEAHPRFRHRRADAMFLREIPLNTGRVLASSVVLWGVTELSSPALTVLLLVLAVTPLLNYALMKNYLTDSAGTGAALASKA
jgi:hypothetical protein